MANIPYPKEAKVFITKPNKENRIFSIIQGVKNTPYYRYIFEQRVGHMLDRDCEIDHVDGNPLNNDPLNLQILTGIENNLKKYINKEGKYSNGSIVYVMVCPCCGNKFKQYKYIVDRNIRSGNKLFLCSRHCNAKYYGNIRNNHYEDLFIPLCKDYKEQIISEYKSYPEILKYIREVGPKRFVELAATCTNVPIPIFDGIIDLISEDLDWMKAIYMVYSNQIKIGLNCGEDPKIIERLSNLIDFMDQAYLSFMNDFVYIPNFYFNDYRSNTNPGIRLFNGEFINEHTREKENLKPGLTPFDCDTNSKYQQLPGSIGLTPYNC